MHTSTKPWLWASLECNQNPLLDPQSSVIKAPFINRIHCEEQACEEQVIADLVGSSHYQAVSDDAAKDEDNAGWVMTLEPKVRDAWIQRIRWIRLIDRLAEQELLHPGKPMYSHFLADWQQLHSAGSIAPSSEYQPVLAEMQSQWFQESANRSKPASLYAWQDYMQAIATYHRADLEIDTIADYEKMLADLAGSFFQVLPLLAPHHHKAAKLFGIVDQFYNHLRDLQEDAERGICYLPNELLDRYGVSRAEILEQRAQQNPSYSAMMQFWLDDYLPKLRCNGHALLTTVDLHLSWHLMRSWSVYRYRRIEQVFRGCQFDYTRFPEQYWQQVRNELPLLLNQAGKNLVALRPPAAETFRPFSELPSGERKDSPLFGVVARADQQAIHLQCDRPLSPV
jgi:15-cis-phytoene synthase